MSRIRKRIWVCVLASVFSALSTRIWPEQAAGLQMAAYSGIIFGLLLVGFGQDRRRRRFWPALLITVALHVTLLADGHAFFPVRTTFLLWIAAGVESTVLGMLMVVMLGKSTQLIRHRRPGEPLPVAPLRRRSPAPVPGGRIGRSS
jgi:hypothetical protein